MHSFFETWCTSLIHHADDRQTYVMYVAITVTTTRVGWCSGVDCGFYFMARLNRDVMSKLHVSLATTYGDANLCLSPAQYSRRRGYFRHTVEHVETCGGNRRAGEEEWKTGGRTTPGRELGEGREGRGKGNSTA